VHRTRALSNRRAGRRRHGCRGRREVLFPAGRYTLYVTEAETCGDDVRLFGFCLSPFGEDCDEWGYASLNELRSTRVRGLSIERDLHFPIATRTVREALTRASAA
jgi:hypothetical protein